MVYVTGDKHGDYRSVERFCDEQGTTKDDVLIVLGDNGVNFWGGERDRKLKEYLSSLPITFLMVRGNHDMRPPKDKYRIEYCINNHGGAKIVQSMCWIEYEFPSLQFLMDGSLVICDTKFRALVIGGAYSVDKQYRLNHGWPWFANEQLSIKELYNIWSACDTRWHDNYDGKLGKIYVFSHTCPLRYKPEGGLPWVKDPDITMETWMDAIDMKLNPDKWFCGHWHIDEDTDKVRFMYNDFIALG